MEDSHYNSLNIVVMLAFIKVVNEEIKANEDNGVGCPVSGRQ